MNTLSIPHAFPRITGNCPSCNGTFETCRCCQRPAAWTGRSVRAWVGEDIHEEDEAKGYEPEELHRPHDLVKPTGPVRAAEDPCPICEYWRCRCTTSLTSVPALTGAGSAWGWAA
ncbi:hypothetical protein ACFUJ0_30080 [Streptomyces sp. NPDC057242]|uniref:hypothetical protein n=1 Tax=Streptomyces sp. NPDC057242 TaxID=3346063 RepID=UPI00363105E0